MLNRNRQSVSSTAHRWAVILAGGDGKRLLPLTRKINGDDRPKQFSAVLGSETLLDQTRRRVARLVAPQRTLVMLTKTHECFFQEQVADVPRRSLVVQPFNHGTALAILYSLMRVCKSDPDGIVAIFPSDHHFKNNRALRNHVDVAFAAAESPKGRVVLLGIEPDAPEDSYGWIEPGPSVGNSTFHVNRFWEKPSVEVARNLMHSGCLWNSFVMVGRVDNFLKLFQNTLPNLLDAFTAIQDMLGTESEERVVSTLYARSAPSNFSDDVLAQCPQDLAVLRGHDLGWSDLGDPGRVLSALASEQNSAPPLSQNVFTVPATV